MLADPLDVPAQGRARYRDAGLLQARVQEIQERSDGLVRHPVTGCYRLAAGGFPVRVHEEIDHVVQERMPLAPPVVVSRLDKPLALLRCPLCRRPQQQDLLERFSIGSFGRVAAGKEWQIGRPQPPDLRSALRLTSSSCFTRTLAAGAFCRI